MLRIGLTGGIGAGKSTVARRLAELGATVVDADLIAREVVAPGSPGLERVVAEFGAHLLGPDGGLDRPALAKVVFHDPDARSRLNAIVHPLIGDRTRRVVEAAPPDAVVVQDIPLLVEGDMAASFPLVLVVHADPEDRVRRLVHSRGMPEDDARARIAAQASDADRRAAADVWLDNSASPDRLRTEVERLWVERLVPFEAAMRTGQAPPPALPVLVELDGRWASQFRRLALKVSRAVGVAEQDVGHIGSTSVPGLVGRDEIDLQLATAGEPARPEWVDALAGVGFLPAGEPGRYRSADPGRPADLRVHAAGSDARLLVEWLRAEPAARAEFAAVKRHAADAGGDRYSVAKAGWLDRAVRSAERWLDSAERATGDGVCTAEHRSAIRREM
jgi:dephospho-CoA kinase